ncbi:MAG: glycerol-3-phosphate acyltransferase [Ilumatobacter sp.]|nr:glycerol-3-phosphate acyltransferase [Ilumatobacter sp.]
MIKRLAVASAVGYLVGTFPTADLVARRATQGRVDLRSAGSGNPGSANALNVLGKKAGAQVLVGDIGKGALASGLGAVVAGPAGAHLAGTSAVAGHCYPVWNGFRGGKGVATSVGQCLATFPAYFPIDVAVAAATAANPRWKQRAFAATLASSICWVVGGFVWWLRGSRNLWGPRPTVLLPLASAASSAIIVQRFVAAGPPGVPWPTTADDGPPH